MSCWREHFQSRSGRMATSGSLGLDLGSSVVWASVSAAVSIVFALSWPALIRSLDAKQWSRALIVLVALILTGAYSISAALGSAMGGRANAAAEERSITDARTKAQEAYDRAKAELDRLAPAQAAVELQALIAAAAAELAALMPARPAGELRALIDGVRLDPRSGGCVAVRGSLGMRCPKLTQWIAEKARAEQREKLRMTTTALTDEKARAEQRERAKSELERSGADLARLPPPRIANSDAVALAAYLGAVGIDAPPDRFNKFLVLLAVLVIECGGGLALAVGMSLADRDAPKIGVADRTSGTIPARSGQDGQLTCPRSRGRPSVFWCRKWGRGLLRPGTFNRQTRSPFGSRAQIAGTRTSAMDFRRRAPGANPRQ